MELLLPTFNEDRSQVLYTESERVSDKYSTRNGELERGKVKRRTRRRSYRRQSRRAAVPKMQIFSLSLSFNNIRDVERMDDEDEKNAAMMLVKKVSSESKIGRCRLESGTSKAKEIENVQRAN